MNPKAEFLKAIMSVLRLESNIYTTGAIETLIERLEVSDYQMFIAYLGERKSDYEKPIENIAKGIEEFYQIKLEPHRKKAKKMYTEICSIFSAVNTLCSNIAEKNLDKSLIEKEVQKSYGKQSKQIQENKRYEFTTMQKIKDSNVLYEDFLNKKRDNKFFKEFKYQDNGLVFTNEVLDVIYAIGLKNADDTSGYPCNKAEILIMEYYLKDKIKPSLTEQIELKETGKKIDEIMIADSVKKLLLSTKYI